MTKRYTVARTIDAPADKAWQLLTDATTYADWNPAVSSIEGSIEVGKTISLVSVVNPKRTFKLGVIEMDEPSRMVWSDGMPLGLFTGERTFTLEPEGDGVRFTMTEEYTACCRNSSPRRFLT